VVGVGVAAHHLAQAVAFFPGGEAVAVLGGAVVDLVPHVPGGRRLAVEVPFTVLQRCARVSQIDRERVAWRRRSRGLLLLFIQEMPLCASGSLAPLGFQEGQEHRQPLQSRLVFQHRGLQPALPRCKLADTGQYQLVEAGVRGAFGLAGMRAAGSF